MSTVDGTNNLDPARPTLLDDSELAAFQGYIRDGGGYAGVHAATDTMHTVPWYSQLTGGGARFVSHPAQQTAVQQVEDRTHPSTEHLGDTWTRFDEWYNFTVSPRPEVRVLTNLDETTYNPGRGAMGADHPLSWCQNFEGGPVLVHRRRPHRGLLRRAGFLQHLLGGIEWTAGAVDGGGDCVTWNEVDEMLGRPSPTARLRRRRGPHHQAAGQGARSWPRPARTPRRRPAGAASAQVRAHVT